MEPILPRLHEALVDALNASRPGWLDSPVTVAEIYQDLVPYRQVRATLGIDLNADYEFALLQLLAGEGGLVRVEPEEARDELRREAAAPNPNLGVYRRFAGCDAWVAPPDADSAAFADASQKPAAPAGLYALDDDLDQWLDEAQDVREPDPEWEAPPLVTEPAPAVAAAQHACVSCSSALPPGRRVRYCPFCGADQERRSCGSCGEALESGWRFCVACGAAADG